VSAVDEVRTEAGAAMSRRDRNHVLMVLASIVVVLFVAGIYAAWNSRNDTICRDGKAPVSQRKGIGFGQIEYRCHDGQLVTK
jgi:hypothetical protein